MHTVQLLCESTSGLNSMYSICCFCSFLLILCSYFLALKILSRIQARSPRHRCGSVMPSPPGSSYFLAVPKLELESRHIPRNGNLCGHREDLEQALFRYPLPCHGPSLPPSLYASDQLINEIAQLINEIATLYPEAPKLFHR